MRISDWSSDVCSSDLSSKRGSTEKKGPLRRVPSKSSSADAIANASLWHSVMASLSRSLAFVPGIRSSSQTDARSRPPTGIIPDVSHMVVVIMTKRLGKRRKLRSEEHTSELQSLMRNSHAGYCLKKKQYKITQPKISQ